MKTGNSDSQPEIVVGSNDLIQIRYDIQEVSKTDMNGKSQVSYSYKYVEMKEEEINKEAISKAIKNNNNVTDEIAVVVIEQPAVTKIDLTDLAVVAEITTGIAEAKAVKVVEVAKDVEPLPSPVEIKS